MLALSFKADLRPVHRAMIALGAKQVPFASALAANNLAKGLAAEERKLVEQTFDTPTPFTQNAYRIEVATKSRPIAVVAAKDIQAHYLEPYVAGGERSLGGKRGMLVPRGAPTNRYGNLGKGQLARLKGKPGVFVGKIRTRGGRTISGVWQRPVAARKGGNEKAGLKLLISFDDTTPVRKRLDFYGRAAAYLRRNAAREFDAALRRAFATARK